MKKYFTCFLVALFLFALPVSCLGQEKTGDYEDILIVDLNDQPFVTVPQLAPDGFSDIHDHWAKNDIQTVCKYGLMSGIGNNREGLRIFSPETNVNRAQLASVLQRTFRLDYGQIKFIKQPLASDYYGDVDNKDWYANAAMLCAINKVFEDGDNLQPNQTVTRIETAQAIERSFAAKNISIPMIMLMPSYQDMEGLSTEEVNALTFVSNTGIMKGDGRNFRPQDGIKRAELARILNRCNELLEVNKEVDESYNGQTLSIREGDTFVLSLDSNPTTGYTWNMTDSRDQKHLILVDQGFQSSAASNIVGQGGKNYWKFKALQAGSTEINLSYGRSWESVQPLKTFQVKVIIN